MSETHILLITLLLPLLFSAAAAARCHPGDESALLAFKAAITADPSGILATWKPKTDCCTWNGVQCRVDERVTELSLYGNTESPNSFLTGTIPFAISKLHRLVGLYMIDLKNITGPFPTALFHLPDLEYVYIENNKLSGKIPDDIGVKLKKVGYLSLAQNRFSGPIPSSVGRMTQLGQLHLRQNMLTGVIPAGVGKLKNLTSFLLDGNSLTGTIPNLSSLQELRSFNLSGNKFSGTIPTWISALSSNLIYLSLANNRLTGRIPDSLGLFTKLDTLDLSGNKLTGAIPASFRNLTKIFNLNLARNALTDPFPVMAVKGIESLDLSYNKLHLGKIPSWVTTSPIIYSLNLAGCGLKMRMEDFVPTQGYFYDYIDLSDNEITGSPLNLLNKTDMLLGFRAARNKLSFDMSKLKITTRLESLDISHNSIYGKVSKTVAKLKALNVSYNRLCGPIPLTKFPASAFVGNKCLCGAPLRPCPPKA